MSLNGQAALHRLALEEERVAECRIDVYVPATRRPHCRGKACQPPVVDIYGFRPLHACLQHLSFYEFHRFWYAKPLENPLPDPGVWCPTGTGAVKRYPAVHETRIEDGLISDVRSAPYV